MTNNEQKKFALKRRRAISPILAVVVLLGITVVAGGIVFSLFSTSATTASSADVIAIQNAQAIKGTDHADITATIKNAGGQPWTKVEMTVAKSELSEPILYESLHEVFQGCDGSISTSDGSCAAGDADERDNPLRAQWLGSLDKTGGTTGEADKGEGIAAGRKLVFEPKDSYRTIKILNGTAVAEAFGLGAPGFTYTGDLTSCSLSTTWSNTCTATLKELDSGVKGTDIACRLNGDDAECKAYTHQDITDSPIGTGQSVYFYADVFTKDIPGLNNQIVRVGDNLVVNIFATNGDGGEARVQTLIKVSGV